ncbi:MAG: citramalate synthase [Coriobacteriales bacterium]|jgi:2-isopropylmalate synthase|nr:citramalate synthase [Coriobacteriales bacterium]
MPQKNTAHLPHVASYDTTLRDGAQRKGVSLSLEDKLHIAEALDELGIDYIEGGFLGSNPKDAAFFDAYARGELDLQHAQLAAFGLPVRRDTAPEDDPALRELALCAAPVITLVGKASKKQVEQVLQASGAENLRMIQESVRYLKAQGKRVFFDAEHYFDGYREDAGYALEVLAGARAAGAEYLVLADTNGGTLPYEIATITRETAEVLDAGDGAGRAAACGATYVAVPEITCDTAPDIARETVAETVAETSYETQPKAVPLGIHAHDDSGCAVANTLEAVLAGAEMVQGTINGYGERVGNANLLTVIADLELKLGRTIIGPERLGLLTPVSRFVADTMNVARDDYAPYVGENAFTHKGGMHVSAEARLQDAYQHVDPASVGNFSHIVMSELAGRAALEAKAKGLDLDLSTLTQEGRLALLERIKQREAQGYSYEAADASLALLIKGELGCRPQYFRLESFRVITDRHAGGGEACEATIKIHVGEERFIATAEGNGPVNALDRALRAAITRFYPQIEQLELHDFKVRVLDGSTGTGAVTRVFIETSNGSEHWGTVGVNENIIEASWDALVDAITYGLMKGVCS